MSSGDDEIGEHWSKVWSGEPHTRPDADFPGPLVKEEHVFDEGEPRDKTRGEKKALQALQSPVCGELRSEDTAEGEKATDKDSPESDWCSAPARQEGHE